MTVVSLSDHRRPRGTIPMDTESQAPSSSLDLPGMFEYVLLAFSLALTVAVFARNF